MKAVILLLMLFVVHTASLWTTSSLAGRYGDTLAHAALPQWYCTDVVTGHLHTDRYLAPAGVDLATNFDSPFPLILTCPFVDFGGHVQFHIFVALQILLIIVTALLVARQLTTDPAWQVVYVLFVWFTGFYFAQAFEHFTLFSGVWGFQLIVWCALTARLDRGKNMIARGALLGLVFAGTFHNVALLTLPTFALIGWTWARSEARRVRGLIAAGCTAAGVFALFFWPSIHAYLTQELVRTPGARALYSSDLLALFFPSIANRIYEYVFALLPQGSEIVLHFERINSLDVLVWVPLIAVVRRRAFWRDRLNLILFCLAALFWWLALGPSVTLQERDLFANPLAWLLDLFPLTLSRTPGRLLTVTVLSLTLIAFRGALERWPRQRWLPYVLIVWALATGPGLNRAALLMTSPLEGYLPMKGLEAIASDRLGTRVAHLPMAPIQDAGQNYMQLIHGKAITAGYLAYTAYPPATPRALPWRSQTACRADASDFSEPSWEDAHRALGEEGIRHVILNKRLLFDASCTRLREWSLTLSRQSWIRMIDESQEYVVLEIVR